LRELAKKASVALSLESDLVELRIDMLKGREGPRELRAGLAGLAKRAIITVRSRSEGGSFLGTEENRLELITSLAELEPAYLDVELATAKKNAKWAKSLPEGVAKIVSWHDFRRTPTVKALNLVCDEALRHGSLAKVITTATGVDDNLRTLGLYEEKPGRVVAFCMGELGTISRVISMRMGAPLAYASLPNEAVAPGQLSISTMRRLRSMVA